MNSVSVTEFSAILEISVNTLIKMPREKLLDHITGLSTDIRVNEYHLDNSGNRNPRKMTWYTISGEVIEYPFIGEYFCKQKRFLSEFEIREVRLPNWVKDIHDVQDFINDSDNLRYQIYEDIENKNLFTNK